MLPDMAMESSKRIDPGNFNTTVCNNTDDTKALNLLSLLPTHGYSQVISAYTFWSYPSIGDRKHGQIHRHSVARHPLSDVNRITCKLKIKHAFEYFAGSEPFTSV